MFKIVDFAHFFVDSQPIRPKFEKVLPKPYSSDFLYSKSDIYTIFTEKALYQNVGKRPFSSQFRAFGAKIKIKTVPKH